MLGIQLANWQWGTLGRWPLTNAKLRFAKTRIVGRSLAPFGVTPCNRSILENFLLPISPAPQATPRRWEKLPVGQELPLVQAVMMDSP